MANELEIFPDFSVVHPGYSIHKKPTWATIVQTPPSGREVTGRQYLAPLWEFNLTFEILREQSQNQTPFAAVQGFTELETLSSFVLARNGQFGAFVFQDPDDFSRTNQTIATGDGITAAFPVVRTFGTGSYAFVEWVGIVDVRTGVTLNVYLNGTPLAQSGNWWIDYDLRTLRFVTPPGSGVVISMDFSFFYFCRFIQDDLDMEEFMTGRWMVKELKFRSTQPDPPSSFNPYTIPNQNTSVTTPQSSALTLIYLEATITATESTAFGDGGYSCCLGLAGLGFNRDNPWGLDANVGTIPSLANGLFLQFIKGSGSNGWGYPNRVGANMPLAVLPSVVGMAINLTTSKVWWRNVTADPTIWYGNGAPGSADPVAGTNGFGFDSVSGDSPISGNVYILAGCGRSGSSGPPIMTLNLSGTFAATPPGSYVAAGGTLDGSTIPPHSPAVLVLSGGNLTLTGGTISGSNQPTAFILSTSSFMH